MEPGRYTKEEIQDKIRDYQSEADSLHSEADDIENQIEDLKSSLESMKDTDVDVAIGDVCFGCHTEPATTGGAIRRRIFCQSCYLKIKELVVVRHFDPHVVAMGDSVLEAKINITFPSVTA